MMLGNKHQSCAACGQNLDAVPLAPMLHDDVWRQFAKPHDTLCEMCFLERAAERRIDLSLQDLRPCPFNLYGIPCWYDLFHGSISVQERQPTDLAEESQNQIQSGVAGGEAARRAGRPPVPGGS
jgi:hypothetical protein